MISDYLATVTSKKSLTDVVFELVFELDSPMQWIAGQYISLKIDEFNRRSYSICSLPNDNTHLTFCMNTKPGGPGSIYIQNIKVGDKVSFKGPLGKFVIDNNQLAMGNQFVFVATGTGIAPVKPMIADLLAKTKASIKLFYGVKSSKNAFYKDFFEDLEKRCPNFKFNLILSETGKHVTDFAKDFKGEIYVCGKMDMIKDILLQHPNIHYESYS